MGRPIEGQLASSRAGVSGVTGARIGESSPSCRQDRAHAMPLGPVEALDRPSEPTRSARPGRGRRTPKGRGKRSPPADLARRGATPPGSPAKTTIVVAIAPSKGLPPLPRGPGGLF